MNVSPCRSCKRPVHWSKTARTGSAMPLDRDPDRGNVLVDGNGRAHVFRDHDAAVAASEADDEGRFGTETYISHHAEGQCPEGSKWKGKQRSDSDAPQAPTPEPVEVQEAMF